MLGRRAGPNSVECLALALFIHGVSMNPFLKTVLNEDCTEVKLFYLRRGAPGILDLRELR
jgi:hypothetical protein